MPNAEPDTTSKTLIALYDAERAMRDMQQKLLRAPHGPLLEAVQRGMKEAAAIESETERAVRLVCLSRVLRAISGPKSIDLIIDMLGIESEEGRVAAGMTLEDAAYDRLGEVTKGVERAVQRLPAGSHALRELPFIMLSFTEADTLAMLRPFLKLKDPEAVAAGIEAVVELADPAAIAFLKPLIGDKRPVQVEDEEGESGELSIGDMVADAIEALQEVEAIMKPSAES